ncbi:hypothetical protein, partial [Vibrio sagamiensis]
KRGAQMGTSDTSSIFATSPYLASVRSLAELGNKALLAPQRWVLLYTRIHHLKSDGSASEFQVPA